MVLLSDKHPIDLTIGQELPPTFHYAWVILVERAGRDCARAVCAAETAYRVPRLLTHLDASVPKRREIHLILDNYATHTHPKVEAWFDAHPRYHRHFVPTSASWLNLIERWFAEITRKRIRRGTFRSVPALIRAIEDYVTHHNRHASPFLWTAPAATILRKVRHCKEVLKTAH